MPWLPEQFSQPVLAQLEAKRQRKLVTVPYFDGLMTGEVDALVNSFAGEPELHDPVRGRVKGRRAFDTFVSEQTAWLTRHNCSVEDVEHIHTERHGLGEAVLHLDGPDGRVGLPVAVAADRRRDGRIEELRVYFSTWPLAGRHAMRPPLLQADPALHESDVVGEYQRALAAGDVDAVAGTFEPDGYAREPAGGDHVHRGAEGLRSFYGHLFAGGGGIPLEHCRVIDDGRACGLEYNVVRWGATQLPPQAGVAVYVRGSGGKLASARIYDDADPPIPAG
ncbi:MAG TPA: nuclear transport factor 2 family protein [Solirubrobacteraceae bacterium]